MRYALTGSHGVGKTSVINGLDDFLIEKGIKSITNSSKARNLKNSGFKINDDADDLSELLIASNHISHFNEDNWFADRCIIDTFGYACHNYFHGRIEKKTFKTIRHMTNKFAKMYDRVFYIPIEFPMVCDGVRKNDELFQHVVDQYIFSYLNGDSCNFTVIKGTVEERMNAIKVFIL
jgi:thymidylate kinase